MVRPGMSDGRVFTNYQANCQINSQVQQSTGSSTNVDYKQYIQQNAQKIMDQFTSYVPKQPQGCQSV